MNTIYEIVSNYFKSRGDIAEIEIFSKKNYMELNFFDSLNYAKMIADFESLFNIVFTSQDLQNPIIYTLSGITEIIEYKLLKKT